ncbi:MAG: DegV family protein [Clostridia bacterium]|nr:DegV family protein [Clostridia bacterium]
MAKIKIITDSGSDIPKDVAEKYNITVLPYMSVFGEKSYRAGVELSSSEFYRMLDETGIIPTTAQTPYPEIYEEMMDGVKNYDSVIMLTLSSKASGQYSTINMIKKEILEHENPNADIHIIDSKTFSLAIALAAIYASELAQSGMSAAEIAEKTKQYLDKWDVYFVVDNLSYLEKGGRINKASAFVGTLLDIKPVLSIRDGLVEAVDKFRGKKKLAQKLIDKIKENPNFDADKCRFAVVHSANEALGEEMKASLTNEFQNAEIVLYNELGPIIGTHTGPGMVGVFFEKK